MIAGCRTEQVAFQFQPARLKVPQDAFVLNKSRPDSLTAQKGSEASIANMPLAGTRSQRHMSSLIERPKTIRKQTRTIIPIAKRNKSYSPTQKKKYRKPVDSLHGLGVLLIKIGIGLFVLFIIALISGSIFFSIFTGILLLLYLALMISNAVGG